MLSFPNLQCPGFDLGLCNLHSEAETLALSLQLHGLTVSSYAPSCTDPSCMLECGNLDIGNIQGDLGVREDGECVPHRQRWFLEKADFRSKRLWFLWRESDEGGEEMRCGCCGGCVFLDGCIQRQQPKEKRESAVYAPLELRAESLKSETGPSVARQLGLLNLRTTLPNLCVKDLDCLLYLHRELLDHYDLRYSGGQDTGTETGGGHRELEAQVSIGASSVTTNASDESFKSALSSPWDDEYASVPDVSEIGLPGYLPSLPSEGKRSRHRKTKSAASHELKFTMSSSQGKEGTDSSTVLFYDPLNSAGAFKGLVPAQLYRPVVLYAPLKKGRREDKQLKRRSDGHRRHRRQLSHESPLTTHRADAGEAQAQLTPKLPTLGGASPTWPSSQQSLLSAGDRNALRVWFPILTPLSVGSLPTMVSRGRKERSPRKKQRAAHWRDNWSGDGRLDERKLAKFSLSVCVNGDATAVLSPPLLSFVDR